MSNTNRPRVAVIGCGGTISSLGTTNVDVMNYPDEGRKLTVAEILDRVPELAAIADIIAVKFREISSSAISVADWVDLREVIQKLVREEPDLAGIVVLHGTGTLEETAFFLHLTIQISQPVVLTGSQRPLNNISSDAPMNLLNAVRVAIHAASRNLGVLVVLNDEIHSARDVVKVSNYRLQTFRSLDYGMLGQIDGDDVRFFRRVDTAHWSNSPLVRIDQSFVSMRVDIVYSYVGLDDLFIKAAVLAGANGLISAGFAPGLTTPVVKRAFEKLAEEDFPIVLCSRAVSGRVAKRNYVTQKGMIGGEDLSPQKARILLMLCLGRGFNIQQIGKTFTEI